MLRASSKGLRLVYERLGQAPGELHILEACSSKSQIPTPSARRRFSDESSVEGTKKASTPTGSTPGSGPPPQEPAASSPRATSEGGGEGGDAEDPTKSPHIHFPLMGELNGWQPTLERAERSKAMRGLMTSPWSSMWASGTGNIIPASILRWMTDLRWQLAGPVYRHVENMSEQLVCESVEGSFDAEEFVDGAKSAVENFYSELAEGSDRLQPMASSMLVERMAFDSLELQAQHGLQLESATANIHHATVISSNLWSANSVARFHPAALEAVNINTSESWLVVSLKLDLTLQAMYKAVDRPVPAAGETDGSSGTDISGSSSTDVTGGGSSAGVSSSSSSSSVGASVAASIKPSSAAGDAGSGVKSSWATQALKLPPRTLHRQGTWLFARGPLPKGPSSNLHLPWRVLSWW